MFDSLSAGKPIIVNSAGWTKELVENNGCGLYVNPNNPSDLVEKIHYLKSNNEILTKMGGKSRELAINKYDKELLADFNNSKKHNKLMYHKNWDTDNNTLRITYLNNTARNTVQNTHLFSFTATQSFKRSAGKYFKKNTS